MTGLPVPRRCAPARPPTLRDGRGRERRGGRGGTVAGAGAPFTRRSATRHLPVARRPAHRGHRPGNRESPRGRRRRAGPLLGVGVHPLPVRLDRGRPLLRPLRVPHRPAAPARAASEPARSTFPRFLLRRGLRIWPLYFAWVAFLALALGKWRGSGRTSPSSPTTSRDRSAAGGRSPPRNSSTWSSRCSSSASSALFGPRGQAWVPLVLLALMPVVRAASLHGAGEAGLERIYGPIHTHCDGLLVGLFLAWASVKRPETLSSGAPASVALAAGGDRRRVRAPGDRRPAVQLQRARIGLWGAGGPRAASRAARSTAHRVAGVSRPVETVVRDVPHPFRGAAQAVAPVDARAGADRRDRAGSWPRSRSSSPCWRRRWWPP